MPIATNRRPLISWFVIAVGAGAAVFAGLLNISIPITFSASANAAQLSAMRKSELINLVRQDCGSCHGMTLRGGLGKPLLPKNLSPLSKAYLAQIILDGVPGTPMPPWRGLLSQQDAIWIAHKLKQGLAP